MIKCSMLINATSNRTSTTQAQPRTGGWSESWLLPATIDVAVNDFLAICSARSRLLPGSASIVGQRYQIVGGGSSSGGRIFPGLAGTLGDIPQMALACFGRASGAPNVCKFRIGGIPDARVTEGEYSPSTQFDSDISNYFVTLTSKFANFQGRLLTNPVSRIVSIDVNGVCFVNDAITLVPGNIVRMLRVHDSFGRPVKGTFTVSAVVDSTHFTLANWTAGVVKSGRLRLDGKQFFTLLPTSMEVSRVVTHKVGRAFFQYRGRASKKR